MAEVTRRRWIVRSAAVLVVGMLAGSVMLTPVGAHIKNFNHLKTKHFYTKKAADARFVNVGEKATSASSADTAKVADSATTATTGLSPVAYAHVLADGSVDETQSRAVADANVVREFTSTYCFRSLTFTFKTAQVTLEHATADASTGMVSVAIPASICAGGAQVEVFTRESTAVFDPEPFYIWFYN